MISDLKYVKHIAVILVSRKKVLERRSKLTLAITEGEGNEGACTNLKYIFSTYCEYS